MNEIDLIAQFIFNSTGYKISDLKSEIESQKYHAQIFKINNRQIIYRKAKITPTKIGQFVTIWKRNSEGITVSFEESDLFDFIVIVTIKDEKIGLFIFPKSVLIQKNIITHQFKAGKRGIRVYPRWDITENNQAQKTQKWQLDYFIDLSKGKVEFDKFNLIFR